MHVLIGFQLLVTKGKRAICLLWHICVTHVFHSVRTEAQEDSKADGNNEQDVYLQFLQGMFLGNE